MKEELDAILMASTLPDTVCELNHGEKDPGPHPAVDYIKVPMGYKQEGGPDIHTNNLMIPVCADCRNALSDPTWALLYCYGCGSSTWVIRAIARRPHKQGLTLLGECPHCPAEEKN